MRNIWLSLVAIVAVGVAGYVGYKSVTSDDGVTVQQSATAPSTAAPPSGAPSTAAPRTAATETATGATTGASSRAAASPTEVGPTDHILGNPNAPVTILEYTSLTCPHCATFHAETLPSLKKKYIDTGKVRLVFRDFPLDEIALRASMLARCARPERYYGFLEVLFRSQRQWSQDRDPMAALARIGRTGAISGADFEACMANESLVDEILSTQLKGRRAYDIRSTPTFVINGKKHVGALSLSEFERILDALVPES